MMIQCVLSKLNQILFGSTSPFYCQINIFCEINDYPASTKKFGKYCQRLDQDTAGNLALGQQNFDDLRFASFQF